MTQSVTGRVISLPSCTRPTLNMLKKGNIWNFVLSNHQILFYQTIKLVQSFIKQILCWAAQHPRCLQVQKEAQIPGTWIGLPSQPVSKWILEIKKYFFWKLLCFLYIFGILNCMMFDTDTGPPPPPKRVKKEEKRKHTLLFCGLKQCFPMKPHSKSLISGIDLV